MDNEFLRYFLPVYFILYFLVLVLIKSYVIQKQIGKSPVILKSDTSSYGLLGLFFKLLMLMMAAYVLVFTLFPPFYHYFIPINYRRQEDISFIGIILLLASFIWIMIAQNAMRKSWRIGIDLETKTELVTTGIFSFSRNPIFLGMVVSLIGLFFATPNVLTLCLMVVGYVTIQMQIRLEEEYLTKMHGEAYLDYKRRVRRMI
jgi:protein-S-isoprenylcysteine O-methyltransferase Ste14